MENQITMDYKTLLHHLEGKPIIYVTGCQRSGTTFAAWDLAQSLDAIHIDETKYQTRNTDILRVILEEEGRPIVIHSVAILHKLKEMPKGVIVYMMRDVGDVAKSMKKFNWSDRFGLDELRHFKPNATSFDEETLYRTKLKYALDNLDCWYVGYDAFKDSPRFLDKEERIDLDIKQVE